MWTTEDGKNKDYYKVVPRGAFEIKRLDQQQHARGEVIMCVRHREKSVVMLINGQRGKTAASFSYCNTKFCQNI